MRQSVVSIDVNLTFDWFGRRENKDGKNDGTEFGVEDSLSMYSHCRDGAPPPFGGGAAESGFFGAINFVAGE